MSYLVPYPNEVARLSLATGMLYILSFITEISNKLILNNIVIFENMIFSKIYLINYLISYGMLL